MRNLSSKTILFSLCAVVAVSSVSAQKKKKKGKNEAVQETVFTLNNQIDSVVNVSFPVTS